MLFYVLKNIIIFAPLLNSKKKMKVFHNFDEAANIKNPVVTTGSFDGVHIGHKVILNRLRKLADDIGGETVLITFFPHPRKVLYPQTEGKDLLMINSQKEKIELLRKARLDNLIIVNFTLAFSQTTSQQFIVDYLLGKLHAKKIIVGFNHHFGHNRQGDYSYLYELSQQYGFGVEEISEQDIENETVSSTKIRKALKEGNIQRANAYLDHQYIITAKAKPESNWIKNLLNPTISLAIEEEEKLVVPDGIYAISATVNNDYCRGMCIVKRHSEKLTDYSIDIHWLDPAAVKPDEEITIYFHKRIKEEHIFETNVKQHLSEAKNEIDELIF